MTTCSQEWYSWVLNGPGSSPASGIDGQSLPWGECISRFTQGWEFRPTSVLKLSRSCLLPPHPQVLPPVSRERFARSPAGSLMRENQDRLEVTGILASGVNVVIHV